MVAGAFAGWLAVFQGAGLWTGVYTIISLPAWAVVGIIGLLASLQGMFVLTSYPLIPENQYWTSPRGDARLHPRRGAGLHGAGGGADARLAVTRRDGGRSRPCGRSGWG